MTIIKMSCIFVIVIFLLWRFIRFLYRFLEKKTQQIQESKKAQLKELRKDVLENRYDEFYYNDSPPFKSKQRKKAVNFSTYIDDNSTYISPVLIKSTFHSHNDNLSGNCGDSSSSDAGSLSCD
ncbi:hypothetical protein [Bacillus cereus]|uniref:hypothetical protein n=1 Tax=Bacillus cereus TaxID=1396 RepID=UPI00217D9835|nr:hypothetical protein [Bacillus cereus]MCS6595302.1 hypothetical protein [Bacillus cereus]